MELSLQSVFGLLIGAILALIIGFTIYNVITAQLPKEIDDATLSAFDEIVMAVKQIESGEINEKKVFVDIEEPFVIIGFSAYKDIELEKLMKGLGGVMPATYYPVLPTDNINNPCDIHKSCLCICPYEKKTLATGANQIGRFACSKYKNKCVEFDVVSLMGDDYPYKGYVFLFPSIGKIDIYSDKEGVYIIDTYVKHKIFY